DQQDGGGVEGGPGAGGRLVGPAGVDPGRAQLVLDLAEQGESGRVDRPPLGRVELEAGRALAGDGLGLELPGPLDLGADQGVDENGPLAGGGGGPEPPPRTP